MNKLKLQLDDLRVDSFDTTPAEKERGTVLGAQCTCYTQCTCPGCDTCDETCGCYTGSCPGESCIGGTACVSDAECPNAN